MNSVTTEASVSAPPGVLGSEGSLKSQRRSHIERAVRLGAFVLIGQGVLWCIILGMANVPVGVALHSTFVAGGFALLYLLATGAWKATLHLTFWLLYAYCIGALLFFDTGKPPVTHLYLLPIAISANFLFMDFAPIWRIVGTTFSIFSLVVIERGWLTFETIVIPPNAALIESFAVPFNVIAAATLTLITLRRFANDVAIREEQLSAANSAIESLLERMLPKKVLQRLREERSTFAEGHNHVTILFADIVGFTPLAARMEPQALVNLLNNIFSRFDQLVEKHGVEKIKTIGDAYMAVSGIPDPRPDHAHAVIRLALDMLDVIRDYPQLKVRIGVNTGDVVAGIIGRKRFIYDLWGDAVNLAASMESLGMPSRIHLSQSTASELSGAFELDPGPTLDRTGKSSINTYFVRNDPSRTPPA